MLTREDMLRVQDIEIKKVEVPLWGTVCLRSLTGKELDQYIQECQGRVRRKAVDVRGLKARLVVRAVCDENGMLLFHVDDAGALNEKSARAVDILFKAIQEMNGLGNHETKALLGNSVGDLTDSSGSS